MELLRSILSAFIFACLLMVAVVMWNAGRDGKHSMSPLGSGNMPPLLVNTKSARQVRAEARQRREQEYKERRFRRVKKAPGAHLYVTHKEAEAIRKSGVLDGLRFDTHICKD